MFASLSALSAFLLVSATPATDKPEVTLVIGTSVEAREVVPFGESQGPGAGDPVYAWIQLKGFTGDTVEQVWLRDGAEVARHTLTVRSPRRWRTWSHHRVRAGAYEVRVLAADGSELAKQAFTVGAPAAGDAD